jgi:hypothetical protein
VAKDIEVITGYTPLLSSSSDRRIQMPEYEEGEDIETEPKVEPNLDGKSLPRT